MDEVTKLLSDHGYDICFEIGHGTFSHCYVCYSHRYGCQFVCKVIHIESEEKRKGFIMTFHQELDALVKLMHPNIINVYDSFAEGNYYVLVLEYCQNGSLEDLVNSKTPIDHKLLLAYVKQNLGCLSYMHENNICHHDIKPSNILIDKFNRVKFADFGISQILKKDEKSMVFGGSVAFMAPEQFLKSPYNSFKADVWSFGVTLYMLTFGTLPFMAHNVMDMYSLMASGKYALPIDCPMEIRKLLLHSLEPDVEKRWTSKQLYEFACSSSSFAEKSPIAPRAKSLINGRCFSLPRYEHHLSIFPSLVVPDITKKKIRNQIM